jgi:hypothetical protein
VVVILPAWAWGAETPPWSTLANGTLVVMTDPTRGGGGPDGPIHCYLVGRVFAGKVEEWRSI